LIKEKRYLIIDYMALSGDFPAALFSFHRKLRQFTVKQTLRGCTRRTEEGSCAAVRRRAKSGSLPSGLRDWGDEVCSRTLLCSHVDRWRHHEIDIVWYARYNK